MLFSYLRKTLTKASYITLAPPRTIVEAQKMTWTTASTNIKIWRWCNASTDIKGTFPCKTMLMKKSKILIIEKHPEWDRSFKGNITLLVQWSGLAPVESKCRVLKTSEWDVSGAWCSSSNGFLQGNMLLTRAGGTHICLIAVWDTVNISEMNPKSISSVSGNTILVMFRCKPINIFMFQNWKEEETFFKFLQGLKQGILFFTLQILEQRQC